jgi:hypothetical protein
MSSHSLSGSGSHCDGEKTEIDSTSHAGVPEGDQDPKLEATGTDEEAKKVSPFAEVKDADIDFPDGGLRAWLVVAGVRSSDFETLNSLAEICCPFRASLRPSLRSV